MNPSTQLVDSLKKANADLENVVLNEGEKSEIQQRIHRQVKRRKQFRTGRNIAVGTIGVLLLAFAGWRLYAPALNQPPATTWQLVAKTNDAQLEINHQLLMLEAGEATVRHGDWPGDIVVADKTRIRIEDKSLTVHAGQARLVIPPAVREKPLVVNVSHGRILVIGTVFEVTQHENKGRVVLERGKILFESKRGESVSLNPGDALEWPIRPAPKTQPLQTQNNRREIHSAKPEPSVQATPKRIRQTAPTVSISTILNKVARAHTTKRYQKAARILREALHQPFSPTEKELLSYELGSILSLQLSDSDTACAHWSAHQSEFAKGAYQREVAQMKKALQCQAPGDDR